ncbi:MAG TPA: hypothetical protein PKK10_02575 [Woeseiaceae bacterium]|nr:hypothetical protein [Woeseiaceae bacterium]
MKNLARLAAATVLSVGCLCSHVALCVETANSQPLTGLEMFDETFGPAASNCELGVLAVGSPLVVTRVSAWTDLGISEADRIVAVNGKPVVDGKGLRDALAARPLLGAVAISLSRGDEFRRVTVQCRDAGEILRIREEALTSVMQSRWDDCIRATYVEEMLWGGPNSQSAGLRLWCHQSRTGTLRSAGSAELEALDAQLLFEYVQRLLVELQYAAGDNHEIRARLNYQAQRIADSGYVELAASLNELLIANLAR